MHLNQKKESSKLAKNQKKQTKNLVSKHFKKKKNLKNLKLQVSLDIREKSKKS